MTRAPDLREVPDLPEEVRQTALNGDLVLFVGAGASMLVGLPSWSGLASLALEDLCHKGCLNYSELDQLKVLDPKKQLSIAELLAEENGFTLDLTKHLTAQDCEKGIYTYLNKIGCACVTTNYDNLLSPRFFKTHDGSSSADYITKIIQMHLITHKWFSKP